MKYAKDSPNYRLLQDQIARYTAQTLSIDIAEEKLDKISRRGTDNIEAYNLYLEGMKPLEKHEDKARCPSGHRASRNGPSRSIPTTLWPIGVRASPTRTSITCRRTRRMPAVLERMFTYFSKASDLDPTFAETNVGLGWYYFNKGDNPRAYRVLQEGPGARAPSLPRQSGRRGFPPEHRPLQAGDPVPQQGRPAVAPRSPAFGSAHPSVALPRPDREGLGAR